MAIDEEALKTAIKRFPWMLKKVREQKPWEWMPEVEHRLTAIQDEYRTIIAKETKR